MNRLNTVSFSTQPAASDRYQAGAASTHAAVAKDSPSPQMHSPLTTGAQRSAVGGEATLGAARKGQESGGSTTERMTLYIVDSIQEYP